MKKYHLRTYFIILTSFLAAGSGAKADDTYSFGGSCPSQGAWTQMALAQTRTITSIFEKLKDNPKCKGIESVVSDLDSAAQALTLPNGKDEIASTVESLPGEIDALRKVMITQGGLQSNIQSLLFKKALTAASIGGKTAGSLDTPLDGTSAIRALYSRTKRATEYGIAATERVFKALPGFDECLIGQPDQGMALISAAVKVGASFASSGEGVGTRLGSALASLVTMMRDRKFTLAMRKNHETEFWLSVSCLLESSTKNFCDAQNAQDLLLYSQKEYLRGNTDPTAGKTDPNYDNPLEGYYLLVRELPMISQWLRAVKLGTTPKLTSDASFQNSAIEKINEMLKLGKNLQATFAQEIQAMYALTDDGAKRNKLFTIIRELVGMMTSERNPATEFFTNTVNDFFMPFYLIGLDSVPQACQSNDQGKVPMEWDRWMRSGSTGFVTQFDDVDALVKTVESRLNLLLEGANQKSGIFFRQRLVVDLLNLVNKTLVGQNMTVRQALKHTDRYLERFNERLTNSYSDNVMRGSVADTRTRIRKVLAAYDGLANYGKALKSGNVPTLDATGKPVDNEAVIRDSAKAVIDEVFLQLNLLYQSDVFLTNRLTTFIDRDFAILMSNAGDRITPEQKQLMKITQEHLIEKMIAVHGVNPTTAKNDLAIAQVVNVRNLQAIEEVFSDTIYVALEELNEIAHGRPASAAAMRKLMQARFEREAMIQRRASLATMSIPGLGFLSMVKGIFAGFIVKRENPDLYQRRYDRNSVSSGDTAFGDFAGFRAQLCAQTLAFENRTRFLGFCKGAVLKSFFSPPDEITKLDLPYDSYLPNFAFNASIRNDPKKSAKAKCAVNDYNIRNWVQFLEERDRSQDTSESDDQ